MKKNPVLIIGLAILSVCLTLGACNQTSQASSGPDGYAVSCDQFGHLSIVRIYPDGIIHHREDIDYQVQDCKTLPDGSTILSKPGTKFQTLQNSQ